VDGEREGHLGARPRHGVGAEDRRDLADEVHAYNPGLECMIPPSAKIVVAVT
jgi:hypothetical protein